MRADTRTAALPQPSVLYCPVCFADLILRNGSHGPFYGCSNYPACKHKESPNKAYLRVTINGFKDRIAKDKVFRNIPKGSHLHASSARKLVRGQWTTVTRFDYTLT